MFARAPAALVLAIAALAACGERGPAPGAGRARAASARAPDSSAAPIQADTIGEAAQATPVPPLGMSDGDTVATGIVRVWGAHPFPRLVLASPPPGGPGLALEGALRDELGALVGLEVSVQGRAIAHQPSPPTRAVLVSRYEILSVAGRKPEVGILRSEGDVLTLCGMRLLDAPDELRAAVGGKVWVLGSVDAGTLSVESYGIIRRP